MTILTPEQVERLGDIAPVALNAQETPGGLITVVVTPTGGCFAVSSLPFEVIGAPEVYTSLSAAIDRMMECARAVASDQFPPIREQVAA